MNTINLVKVNDITIQMIVDKRQKLVPIKPICEALGIDFDSQRKKLNEHFFLSSTAVLSTAVGADTKQREMVCLPYRYIFGWLFTINPKNVKEEAREAVEKYGMKCYDILFDYFSDKSDYIELRSRTMEDKWDAFQLQKTNFKNARTNMYEAEKEFEAAKSFTFEEYRSNKNQFTLAFDDMEEII
jgi:hypothetical protein